MRDGEPDGLCPIEDKSPELFEENDVFVDVFYACLDTAKQICSKRRTTFHLVPSEILQVLRSYGVQERDFAYGIAAVKQLQGVWNRFRRRSRK